MKVYLMKTNAGRNMIINEDNKWYYFAYVIKGCNIDCKDVHESIEKLEKHIKAIYTNDDVTDNSYFFNHIFAYDGLDACSLLHVINSDEIRQGIKQGDLTRMYFVCEV